MVRVQVHHSLGVRQRCLARIARWVQVAEHRVEPPSVVDVFKAARKIGSDIREGCRSRSASESLPRCCAAPASGCNSTNTSPSPATSFSATRASSGSKASSASVWLALYLWAHPQLAQDEEPGGAGGKTRGRRGLGWETLEMTTRTHFSFRVDTWTPDGESIVESPASKITKLPSLPSARPAKRWPGTPTQGARVIEDSRRLRLA